ncbi:MAG: sugar-transfer associated ATP-grasp domain-containing protein [Pseudomonadota bacterium]
MRPITRDRPGKANERSLNEAFYAKKDWLLFRGRHQPGFTGPQIFFRNQNRKSAALTPILAVNTATCQSYRNFTRRHRYLGSLAKSLLLTPIQIAWIMRSRAAHAKRVFGRSYTGQYADMMRAWWFADLQPQEYYNACLAQYLGSDALYEFLDTQSLFRTVAVLQLDLFGEPPVLLNDKAVFGQWLRDNQLPGAREVAVKSDEMLLDAQQLNDLGDQIIIKPCKSGFGRDIEVWHKNSNGAWGQGDHTHTTQQLIEHITALAGQTFGGLIVQERLHNHRDIAELSGPALATCRFVTIHNQAGVPEIAAHIWRMGWPGSNIDNFNAGGFYWLTNDLETGSFMYGIDRQTEATQRLLTRHPVTGAHMVGSSHPHYARLRDLVLAAHAKLPDIMLIGWDVAMTSDGPKLIEMNTPCSFTPRIQRATDGLGRSRCGEILAHYAEKWLARRAATPSQSSATRST